MRLNEDGMPSEFQLGTRVKCESLPGVACYVSSWDREFEPEMYWLPDPKNEEDGMWVSDETEGEWIQNPQSNWVYVTMVGDDREHYVEFHDLTVIDEDEYCSQCGQMGCGHG